MALAQKRQNLVRVWPRALPVAEPDRDCGFARQMPLEPWNRRHANDEDCGQTDGYNHKVDAHKNSDRGRRPYGGGGRQPTDASTALDDDAGAEKADAREQARNHLRAVVGINELMSSEPMPGESSGRGQCATR